MATAKHTISEIEFVFPEIRRKPCQACAKPVDWDLIETMLPDMLCVAVSIAVGKVKPSTRKMGPH
jgi:hypothetical protein